MKFDRSTAIGFVVLMALLAGYFYYNYTLQQEQLKQQQQVKREPIDDDTTSIGNQSSTENADDEAPQRTPQGENLPLEDQQVKAEKFAVENDIFKIIFNNKGAKIEQLVLKKYKKYGGGQANLINPNSWEFKYFVDNPFGKEAYVTNLVFSAPNITYNEDKSIGVTFVYGDEENYLSHIYTIKPDKYIIDFDIKFSDRYTWFRKDRTFDFLWQNSMYLLDRSVEYEKAQSQLVLLENDDFDYFSIGNGTEESFKERVKWIGVKQQFFNQTIISKTEMSDVKAVARAGNDTNLISKNAIEANVDFSNVDNLLSFGFYLGPNDYNILKKDGLQLERIVNYGQGLYAFIRVINIWFIKPIFTFLQGVFSNFGVVILFLTLIIRAITSPLAYKGYVSSAKMKVLKPEMDKLKEKYKDDKQSFALKQMELYKSAGANPLGGCLPALLQLPIFVSLYYFFNATIQIRDKSFLWCSDISSYDSIYNFGFDIPFYGNHISLFTLLMVITTLFSTLIGMGMNPSVDNSNPAIKYMPYIMPIIFLGFFNSMPAALTWYYTVSNIITLGIQLFIQKVMIDHDKLALKMKEYRAKPKKKSSWQERIDKYQAVQQKVREMKEKNKR